MIFLILAPLVVIFILAAIYLVPWFDRMFSKIWEDPSQKERRQALARLNELYVDGHVPEEVAVMMASAEMNTSEDRLMKLTNMISPADLKAVLTGRKTMAGVLLARIEKSIGKR